MSSTSPLTAPLATIAALLVTAMAGCAAPRASTPVTVAVQAQAADRDRIAAAITRDAPEGITPTITALPSPRATPTKELDDDRIVAARAAYAAADASACARALGDVLDLARVFEDSRRSLAARLLLWRTACAVAAGDAREASEYANAMATLGLDVPDDIGQVSVEVEALVQRVLREGRLAAPVTIGVSTNVPRAELHVDGRATACAAPCALPLLPGTHWITASAAGFATTTQRVETGGGGDVVLRLEAASPALAGRQWSERFATSPSVETPEAMRVLSLALRARRLVYLQATERDVRGVLLVDDEVRARTERSATATTLPERANEALRDLVVDGELAETRPLYARPLFWVVLATSAIAASLGTYALLYEPPERTEIRFR